MHSSKVGRITIAAGPVIALVVGSATSSIRGQIGATNVGIALAIVVVLAALSGRAAGLLTAAAAATTFNFFHTQPYHSLRIHETRDVVIVALLAGLGLVVSDFTAWRRRRDAIAFRHWTAAEAPVRITDMLQRPSPVGEVWPAVSMMIMDQLTLADVYLAPLPHTDLPLISRTGAMRPNADDGFFLPSHGAAIPVVSENRTLGHLVLQPQAGITSLWVERRVVIALADHLTIALTYTGHDTNGSSAPNSKINHG